MFILVGGGFQSRRSVALTRRQKSKESYNYATCSLDLPLRKTYSAWVRQHSSPVADSAHRPCTCSALFGVGVCRYELAIIVCASRVLHTQQAILGPSSATALTTEVPSFDGQNWLRICCSTCGLTAARSCFVTSLLVCWPKLVLSRGPH